MSSLRILAIAHDHPDWINGGTEILAHDLARALDAREGVEARFLAVATGLQRPGAAPGSLGALGDDFVLQTGAYDRFSMLRLDGEAWLASLARVLGTVRPHVVHLHGLDRIGAEVIPAVKRLAPKCRIVLTLHDYQPICPNEGLMLTGAEGARCAGARPDRCRRCFPELGAARHALRQAHLLALLDAVDLYVAPSTFLRDRYIDWGLDAARIVHVPTAVACGGTAAQGPSARRGRPDRFAFFGNIARHKGALVLLDAVARLKAEGADFRVALHGGLNWPEESFRQAFETKLAAAAPLAQHLGPYDRSEIVALMRAADWVIMPSLWWENAPLVILEARAAGRPVICSGIGGMAELVRDGADGLHVPPGDAAALAETMRMAAADPGLWARLAGTPAAPPRHDQYVDRHLDLFRSLLDRVPA